MGLPTAAKGNGGQGALLPVTAAAVAAVCRHANLQFCLLINSRPRTCPATRRRRGPPRLCPGRRPPRLRQGLAVRGVWAARAQPRGRARAGPRHGCRAAGCAAVLPPCRQVRACMLRSRAAQRRASPDWPPACCADPAVLEHSSCPPPGFPLQWARARRTRARGRATTAGTGGASPGRRSATATAGGTGTTAGTTGVALCIPPRSRAGLEMWKGACLGLFFLWVMLLPLRPPWPAGGATTGGGTGATAATIGGTEMSGGTGTGTMGGATSAATTTAGETGARGRVRGGAGWDRAGPGLRPACMDARAGWVC